MSLLPGIQVAVTKTLGGGLIVAAELSESARDDLEINTSSWPFFISQKLWVYRRFRKLILKRSTKPSKRYQYWAHIRAIFRLEMFVSELIPNINVANWPMVELRSHRRHGPILGTQHSPFTPVIIKFVITFEGAANPTHNLSLCDSHNHNWYG